MHTRREFRRATGSALALSLAAACTPSRKPPGEIASSSPANATKGASLTMAMTDGVNQILFGRADLSTLDGLVKTWRSTGGDTIRAEYEDALAKSIA